MGCCLARPGTGCIYLSFVHTLFYLSPLLHSLAHSRATMAETTHLATHTDPSAVPSAALIADKEPPILDFELQPLTFIVNLAVQDGDDHVKQAAETRHDSLRSESTSIPPPSPLPSLPREDAGFPSPSVTSDQAELESANMPAEIAYPPGLKETPSQPNFAAPSPVALGKTPEALGAENAPLPMDDAAHVPVAAPSWDVAIQTLETPRTESAAHQDVEAGPYVPDDVFEIDLSIFETYNPALYSLADVQPLDSFIPPSIHPDKLLVHDPTQLTNTTGSQAAPPLRRDAPITYVRIFPEPTDSRFDKPADAAKNGGRTAHLYLSNSNHLGSGNHSTVYRAPLELRLDPSSPARSRVSVAVKMANPRCHAHKMLWQEARMYNAFPEAFMEDTVRAVEVPAHDSGSTKDDEEVQVPPTSQSVDISPAEVSSQAEETSQKAYQHVDAPGGDASEELVRVPQPLRVQGNEFDDATPCDVAQVQTAASEASNPNEALNADDGCASAAQDETAAPPESDTAPGPAPSATVQRTEALPAVVPKFFGFYAPLLPNGTVCKTTHCEQKGCYRVPPLPTPILLIEECGEPIRTKDWNREQREKIYHLFERLHEDGFVQYSSFERNMLVQPGPLSVPREQRSMNSPSFRIIDFGRGEALSLGCRESWFSDWKSDEEYWAKRELRLLR
ncbi:hypothetical protein PYCCODRAFT_567466 [Trametes coccinea BRFM310]|uniref:Protein kinase domain-containing protein n=1 Tax=Trametes coccinea (strain BRFM310) TaxID=1353009 RepID=A0A1Y2IIQ4_TRAC3|nr:hypothetical protein PYCCODRAFT_567466 [Trametes coccinea BRFM310]